MTLDFRTRIDGSDESAEPASFFEIALPDAFERSNDLLAPAVLHLAPTPLTVVVENHEWTLQTKENRVVVARGGMSGAKQLRLSAPQLRDLVQDQVTPNGWFTRGNLDSSTSLGHLLDWWLLIRGAIDSVAPYVPESARIAARIGGAVDLNRRFNLDSDPGSMRRFLEETGFLRIRGVFSREEMAALYREMDECASSYTRTDKRSFWATTSGGDTRLVRMQYFDMVSERAAALANDERVLRIAALSDDCHELNSEAGLVEALIKPTGIADQLSDFPWHKDCSLGRHSYECCSLTLGISVTGSDLRSGQLRVVAGSHRALLWPVFAQPGLDLPVVDLSTDPGDVTVHLSCTLHMSQSPVSCERRVLYMGFRLPVAGTDAARQARLRSGLRTADLF